VDTSIFDVDHPIVLDDGAAALWSRGAPAPLLVAALSRPGTRVLQMSDSRVELIVLAALLGAEALVRTDSPTAASAAELNAVCVQSVEQEPRDVDLLIVDDEPVPQHCVDAVLLCIGGAEISDGRIRVDVIESDVVVDHGAPPPSPHLRVPPARLEEVVTRTEHATDAFIGRRPNRWANHAFASSMRLVDNYRTASLERDALAVADIRRAHAQMRQAREELLAVRRSRSWRYTRFLRQLSGP
jgi:hypothetical protein